MKPITHLLLTFALTLLFCGDPTPASAQSDANQKKFGDKAAKTPNPGKRPSNLPGGNPDPFAGLPPEQREKLRESIRRAWNDPAVIQARDEVKVATEAYQNALRNAIDRSDPESAKLIEKYRQSTQSESKGYLFPGGNNARVVPGTPSLPGAERGRDWRDFDSFLIMENPPFLRDLNEEKKNLYKEAHRKAMANAEVRGRMESLKTLRREDDEFRKRRTEAIRAMHQVLREALVEADPRISEFLPAAMPLEGKKNSGPEKEPLKPQG